MTNDDNKLRMFTSESVSDGHPDKVADQISDAILDALLRQDPYARVAVETMVKDNNCIIGGEVSAAADVDYESIARQVISDIGYTEEELGFCSSSCKITVLICGQSVDIAEKVLQAKSKPLGAGDQGMMFGYASDETSELMPLPILLSHRLLQKHQQLRQERYLPWLLMDAKSQVTVAYDSENKPKRVDTVVLSTQHRESIATEELAKLVRKHIVESVIPEHLIDNQTKYFINRNGQFIIGGPKGDCGLTGRKIIVDTYGGMARHGGGAFSGKDGTKVDRSAAYACRYVAKNIVASGIAKKCEIQVSYAIGLEKPMSIYLDTFNTMTDKSISEADIVAVVNKLFDLTPQGIIDQLQLRRPIYRDTSTYGHFGNPQYSWEQTDKAELIKKSF